MNCGEGRDRWSKADFTSEASPFGIENSVPLGNKQPEQVSTQNHIQEYFKG